MIHPSSCKVADDGLAAETGLPKKDFGRIGLIGRQRRRFIVNNLKTCKLKG